MLFRDKEKTRAVVDLEAIANNYNVLKKMNDSIRIAAVVKSDAYGHGAVAVSKRLEKEGCDFFTVATIDEALELRENGIKSTVLILGYVLDDYIDYAIENDISLAVDTCEKLEKIASIASGRKVKIHIKLDTGMNRTGFDAKYDAVSEELDKALCVFKENSNLICEGVFSHFAVADEKEESSFTNLQFERFEKSISKIREHGVNPQICHICNSAGFFEYGKRMHLDAVRQGILLYGCSRNDARFKPSMQFITKIINIHNLKAGESVGYGLKFTAEKDMKIAVIAAGYADGLKRCLSCGKGYVLCSGKKAPFVGRICMNMAMIDVTDIPDVKIEDDAVIFGLSNGVYLSADEVAECADTISYEIICNVSHSVPRVYLN